MVFKTFHKGKYFITFKRGFEESKKDLTLAVDKLYENDSLVRLHFISEFVYKLHRTFLIVQQINPIQYNFEVVEHNEFRRLIHLSLKTGPACDSDVKQHMAETIGELKKSLAALKSSASSNEMMWHDKCLKMEAKIHDLTLTVSKMEEDKLRHEKEFQDALKMEKDRLAQEKLQLQRSAEINTNNLLAVSQDNLTKKEKEIQELTQNIKQHKDSITQLEYQISDKTQRTIFLEKEVQKTHIEVATLKAKNATLEKDILEKEKLINQVNSKCAYLEKAVKDSLENIEKLNETIQTQKMEKASLERRLTLSESLVHKNTETANSTGEQLLKANQIITKQNSELIEMKEKLLCRTAIALEQEKVIERNTKEIDDLKSQIEVTIDSMDKLRSELESLKEKYVTNEQALKDRDETIKNNNMVIQWLHKKVDENGFTNGYARNTSKTDVQSAASSTPYFMGKRVQNDSSQETDETINFYATSKLSSIEESPQPLTSAKNGLDPKYLKPASEDNQTRRKDGLRSSSSNTQNKGKENKVTDLPKVDYREKKSSRPNTYRATPVSAYFP
ncbi:spindle assembly abnormal protein 6 homolog isoform X2 [Bicyclus anynana]|uniref:Spindle assembly abnormal protein 6 homolog isoform X2 n=1 Tax=Bicyclus anynana TaxID=110368 RepID=A0ABM3LQL6_BICAN|nr:spindle assembly abnormal protein 6 homolog isoform X2 [Bicyclus anynana]